jgi:hypothetical protein
MSSSLSNNPLALMIDAIATTRSLPWPTALPRRRARRLASNTRARQAARHGLRGALQGLFMTAAVMAAAGAVGGSRGPVVLTDPGQTGALQVAASTVALHAAVISR